jgi:hypothetical protein
LGLLALTFAGFRAFCRHRRLRSAAGSPSEGNTYDLYVGAEEQYDDNLYRVSTGADTVATLVAPNASRADHISTVSAGAMGNGCWAANSSIWICTSTRTVLPDNTMLNNTCGDLAKLLWDWQVGPYFSGHRRRQVTRTAWLASGKHSI